MFSLNSRTGCGFSLGPLVKWNISTVVSARFFECLCSFLRDHGNPCGLGRGAPRGRPWPHSSGVVRVVSVTPEGIERHSTRRLVTTPLMVEFGVFRLERNSCATVVDLRFVLPCSNNHGRTLETLLHHSSQIRETSSPSFFSRPPPSPSPKPTSVGPPPGA